MKRSGFTMIELIFVIVIIGILSAVALPKFLGVSKSAHLAKVKSYIGSFNMTTGPALWSASLQDGKNGSIKTVTEATISQQLTPPSEITVASTATPFNSCSNTLPDVNTTGTPDKDYTVNIGGDTSTYTIGCVDGNESAAPQLYLMKSGTVILN